MKVTDVPGVVCDGFGGKGEGSNVAGVAKQKQAQTNKKELRHHPLNLHRISRGINKRELEIMANICEICTQTTRAASASAQSRNPRPSSR